MIHISKEEAFQLRNAGHGDDIHMASRDKKSKGKRYFATESFKTMKLLRDIREGRVVGTYGR